MKVIAILFSNKVLIAAALSWMAAQLIKTFLTLVSTKKFEPERIFGAGGMPSAHSAMVCSLLTGIGATRGLNSPEFALAVAFAGVTMYDAMGVRRAAGEQVDVMEKDEAQEISDKELTEYLGHTPLEVLAGALLGIIMWIIIV